MYHYNYYPYADLIHQKLILARIGARADVTDARNFYKKENSLSSWDAIY